MCVSSWHAVAAADGQLQAPRYTYLPLLIPEIRENLVDLVLDEEALEGVGEKDWWFEEEADQPAFAVQGACKWHWPLDLIELYSIIAHPHDPTNAVVTPRPLRLVLHLKNPPSDKLLVPNSLEACKNHFVNSLKEADFVKWRNTNKVTSLRKVDLDAGWDGIVQDDYDLYMRMATRLLPLPIPSPVPSAVPSRPASTDPGSTGPSKPDSSYAVRALPIKIYLPGNAPVVQEVIPPMTPSGKPQTLLGILNEHLPLLFPSSSSPNGSPYPLAIPLAQGIELPPDAEVAWLASCLCGADGWLRIGIQLRAE
ncbi:autophagy protein Apg5-domain-containing protein [Papiliotrema laurentii]|uniref:Autophagy protein 5 n=1 Tax=Papiliotrema laurentii TaxID=5418 RepID=A0AAD9CU00_PAPLA|nr:autophagy protein Apg5-domain-containing protein [Papiliotrema laurentii]